MPEIKLEYYGKVSAEGVITLPKRMRQEMVQHFSGKQIEVKVQRKRKYRSSPQNRYYWGVVIPFVLRGFIDLGHNELSEGSDESKEAIHSLLKQRFLHNGYTVEDKQGNVYELPPSTTRCSTTEFMDYLAQVVQWSAEFLGIHIPEPEEQLEIFK